MSGRLPVATEAALASHPAHGCPVLALLALAQRPDEAEPGIVRRAVQQQPSIMCEHRLEGLPMRAGPRCATGGTVLCERSEAQAEIVIRSKSGVQSIGLPNTSVCAPAFKWMGTCKIPTWVQLPVGAKVRRTGAPPSAAIIA